MKMARRIVRRTLFAVALLTAVLAAAFVPASDGGLLPSGLVLLAVSAQALRRLTSPESRRA